MSKANNKSNPFIYVKYMCIQDSTMGFLTKVIQEFKLINKLTTWKYNKILQELHLISHC